MPFLLFPAGTGDPHRNVVPRGDAEHVKLASPLTMLPRSPSPLFPVRVGPLFGARVGRRLVLAALICCGLGPGALAEEGLRNRGVRLAEEGLQRCPRRLTPTAA